MTKTLFAIQVRSIDHSLILDEYISQLQRIQSGVHRLLEPLRLHSAVTFHLMVCNDRKEWLEVRLSQGQQLSFLDEFEKSIGSNATHVDIEGNAANKHVIQSIQVLHELQADRVWKYTEFLNRIPSGAPIITLGRQLAREEGGLSIRMSDGHISKADILHRRFSAISEEPSDLVFLPVQVGMNQAAIHLSKTAQRSIGAKNRRVDLSWHQSSEEDISDQLYRAAKEYRWLTARCRVVHNSAGGTKGLLLECLLANAVLAPTRC